MKLLHIIFGKYISFMTKNELKSTVYDLELFQKILLMLIIVNIASMIRSRASHSPSVSTIYCRANACI